MRSSLGKTWGPSPELSKWVWTAVVRPALTYACFIWGGNLKPGQAKKLASLQRQALMLTGHLRKGTPTTGLNVVLDALPTDLFIAGEIAKTRIRLRHRLPRDWNGCGPGPYGKFGHIRLSDFLIDQLNIPDLQTDDAVKSKLLSLIHI